MSLWFALKIGGGGPSNKDTPMYVAHGVQNCRAQVAHLPLRALARTHLVPGPLPSRQKGAHWTLAILGVRFFVPPPKKKKVGFFGAPFF